MDSELNGFSLCADVESSRVYLWRNIPLFLTQDIDGYWKVFRERPFRSSHGDWYTSAGRSSVHGKSYILLAKSKPTWVADEAAVLVVTFPE